MVVASLRKIYRNSISTTAIALAGCAFLVACGGEEEQVVERFPELSSAPALELSSDILGVGYRHGEAMRLTRENSAAMKQVTEIASHAFLHVKSYDEFAPVFGEYYVYRVPDGMSSRGPTDFQGQNRDKGRLAPRAMDLMEEVINNTQNAGGEAAKDTSFVIDFWRTRGDWYVRWDGLLSDDSNRIGKGAYGFYRDDMADELLSDIETIAADLGPRYMVIGDEMEKLIAMDGGQEGLSSTEFMNFSNFYKKALEKIVAASPETKVGAGINWDRFVKDVVPQFSADGTITNEAIDAAFAAIILPFAEAGGIVALSSYAKGGDDHLEHYQFLRRIPALYGVDLPVVFYSVSSPVENRVAYAQQRIFFEEFLTKIGGVNVEALAWRMLMNFDGSETNDQNVTGRCEAMISEERGFIMPRHHCYDGFFSSMFQPKPIFTYIEQAISGN